MYKIITTEEGTTKAYSKKTGKLTFIIKEKQNWNAKQNYKKEEKASQEKNESVSPKNFKRKQLSNGNNAKASSALEDIQGFQQTVTCGLPRKSAIKSTLEKKQYKKTTAKSSLKLGALFFESMFNGAVLIDDNSAAQIKKRTKDSVLKGKLPKSERLLSEKTQYPISIVVNEDGEEGFEKKEVPNAYYDNEPDRSGSTADTFEETDPYVFEIYDGITGKLKVIERYGNPKKCTMELKSCMNSSQIPPEKKKKKVRFSL